MSFLRVALDAGRRSEIDVAYQEGAEYLQNMGIESKGEVARILDIAMNPNSLFLTLRDKKRAVNTNVCAFNSGLGQMCCTVTDATCCADPLVYVHLT